MRACNFVGILAAALLAVLLSDHATAATIPFVEDFDDNAAPDFTYSATTANITPVVGGGVLTIDHTLGASTQAINALVNISGANGVPIVMDTDITPTIWHTAGGNSGGFLAFSTNPALGAFPSGANSGYLADIVLPTNTSAGFIRIFNNATATTIIDSSASPFAAGSLALNETYHLTFTATPAGLGLVNLSLTLTDTAGTFIDGDGIVTISTLAPVAESTGTFFGYRHRVGSNGTSGTRTLDAVYDNFSISAVPEPNSFVLIGMAAIMFGRICERKRKLTT